MWKPADTVACYKEGWAPFTQDDGTVVIQAVDDPDNVADEFGFAFSGKRFCDQKDPDNNARRHVRRQAAKGSKLHMRALQLALGKKQKKP